ncbi:hypothetical protein BKA70DRAFT_1241340 [Coprinopsis sp. MPI-PUGE-AT-0042]|nr:hypothetical protein BKA70DRAFT_1241340 [Coprinopsis sp. MPI-PUGE-AT-0042]
MAEGFGSGPEARECSGTRDMGWKRAEASRSSVARRRRQGDGIEQRWDGWGSGEVQPASVGPEMVRSSAVRGQGVLWHMTSLKGIQVGCDRMEDDNVALNSEKLSGVRASDMDANEAVSGEGHLHATEEMVNGEAGGVLSRLTDDGAGIDVSYDVPSLSSKLSSRKLTGGEWSVCIINNRSMLVDGIVELEAPGVSCVHEDAVGVDIASVRTSGIGGVDLTSERLVEGGSTGMNDGLAFDLDDTLSESNKPPQSPQLAPTWGSPCSGVRYRYSPPISGQAQLVHVAEKRGVICSTTPILAPEMADRVFVGEAGVPRPNDIVRGESGTRSWDVRGGTGDTREANIMLQARGLEGGVAEEGLEEGPIVTLFWGGDSGDARLPFQSHLQCQNVSNRKNKVAYLLDEFSFALTPEKLLRRQEHQLCQPRGRSRLEGSALLPFLTPPFLAPHHPAFAFESSLGNSTEVVNGELKMIRNEEVTAKLVFHLLDFSSVHLLVQFLLLVLLTHHRSEFRERSSQIVGGKEDMRLEGRWRGSMGGGCNGVGIDMGGYLVDVVQIGGAGAVVLSIWEEVEWNAKMHWDGWGMTYLLCPSHFLVVHSNQPPRFLGVLDHVVRVQGGTTSADDENGTRVEMEGANGGRAAAGEMGVVGRMEVSPVASSWLSLSSLGEKSLSWHSRIKLNARRTLETRPSQRRDEPCAGSPAIIAVPKEEVGEAWTPSIVCRSGEAVVDTALGLLADESQLVAEEAALGGAAGKADVELNCFPQIGRRVKERRVAVEKRIRGLAGGFFGWKSRIGNVEALGEADAGINLCSERVGAGWLLWLEVGRREERWGRRALAAWGASSAGHLRPPLPTALVPPPDAKRWPGNPNVVVLCLWPHCFLLLLLRGCGGEVGRFQQRLRRDQSSLEAKG